MGDHTDDPATADDLQGPDTDETPASPSKLGRLTAKLKRLPLVGKVRALDKRKRLIVGASGGVLLLAGIVVPLLLLGGDDHPKPVVVSLGGPLVQHEFPMFLADLTPSRRRSSHVKMKMIIEIDAEHLHRLTEEENAVMAAVIAHLRDQKREDLYGKDGTTRLRNQLLAIINHEIAPAHASSILFTEFLVD